MTSGCEPRRSNKADGGMAGAGVAAAAAAGAAAVAAGELLGAPAFPATSAANATATARTQPKTTNTVLFFIKHLPRKDWVGELNCSRRFLPHLTNPPLPSLLRPCLSVFWSHNGGRFRGAAAAGALFRFRGGSNVDCPICCSVVSCSSPFADVIDRERWLTNSRVEMGDTTTKPDQGGRAALRI